MRLLKVCGLVLGCIVLAFIAYGVQWQFQYRRAEAAATEFCESVPLGSGIAATRARLDAQADLHHGAMGADAYVVIFRGPIFNAFTCELTLADTRVTARRVSVGD